MAFDPDHRASVAERPMRGIWYFPPALSPGVNMRDGYVIQQTAKFPVTSDCDPN